MKNLKYARLLCLIFGVILIAIITSSCKDDNEVAPDYVGKWMTMKSVPSTNGFVSVSYSLILTDQTFIETFLDVSITGRFITIEGSVSVSGNIMKYTPDKIIYSTYNSSTATDSGPYDTFTNKDTNFNLRLDGLMMPTSNYQVEYNLVDGQLIFKIDYDMDGIYSENQKSVYTKQ